MKVTQFPNEITDELAEESGWHIGDGSMNYYNRHGEKKGIYQLRGHIEDDRNHYLKRIKPIFKNLYGVDLSLREMPSTRVFGFQIWSDDLVKFKENLGLPLGPKLSVEIPSVFLQNDNLKASIVRGIFDTDGCVSVIKKNNKLYPIIQLNTISHNLAVQLRDIFNELGLRATMHEQPENKERNKRKLYIIAIRGVVMFHKFINIIFSHNPKHLAKYIAFTQSFK